MEPPSNLAPRGEPSGALDFAPAAERILATALRLLGGRRAHLYRLDPDGETFTRVAAAGEGDAKTPHGGATSADIAMSGRAVRERRAICTPDVFAEPDLSVEPSALTASEGAAALAAVPLRAGVQVVGTLVLADRAGRRYTDQELALLSVFGDQAVLLFENARGRAELVQQQHEAFELARVGRLISETLDLATVSDRIAEGVLGLLGVHSSAIRLSRPDGMLGALALGGLAKEYGGAGEVVPAGIGLVGRAAIEGRPMWTSDIRSDDRFQLSPELRERNVRVGIIAGLAVPLRVGGEVIGVLSVGSPTPRIFTAEDIALLQTFADQAAIAIHNALAREVLAKQAERLRILHEIDRAVITEQAPVAIAEAVLGRLRDLLGVPRAIVNLFDLETGEVEWLAAVGRHRMHLGPGVRYPLSFAGDIGALRRGEPQVIDVHALPSSPHADALLASGVQAYMVVPMRVGGELIGSVSIGGERADFPPEQVTIAQEVATQLAIAITQARLHEQVARQAAELEQRVQERTRELEAANRELDAFASMVSHDLKTPLRAVAGYAHTVEEEYGDRLDDTGRRYLATIRSSAGQMGQLIDDLLRYSRIEHHALERRPVLLKPLLDQLLEAHAAELRERELTVTEDLAVAEVTGEREGLREALANLLSNAVKFSPRRGGSIAVRSSREGDDVVIAVADRGVGFDMQYHDRIFGIFERLHLQEEYPGTGVGLAIVRKVAERHGGRAWAQSEIGKGSVFFLAIPAAAP